jgi:hypothetical protein
MTLTTTDRDHRERFIAPSFPRTSRGSLTWPRSMSA